MKSNRNPLGVTPEEFSAHCRQMDKDARLISAHEIVLFACNTGSLYQKHLTLARGANNTNDWSIHIQREVLPAYRRDLHEPYARMTSDDLATAAADLRDYYHRHVSEF